MSADTSPTLERLLFDFADARLAGVWTGQPARVERYDAAKQRVDVQPLVMQRYVTEDGAIAAELVPIVNDVPVAFPGGGAYSATFPIAAGDVVWLSHGSGSMDRWKARGGVVDPEDDRRHNLSDAIAIPMIRDFAHPRTSAPTDRARFGRDGGVALEVTSTEVLVGGGAGHDATFMATAFIAALDSLMSAIGSASNNSTAVAAAYTAFKAALNAGGKTTVAKVK